MIVGSSTAIFHRCVRHCVPSTLSCIVAGLLLYIDGYMLVASALYGVIIPDDSS